MPLADADTFLTSAFHSLMQMLIAKATFNGNPLNTKHPSLGSITLVALPYVSAI